MKAKPTTVAEETRSGALLIKGEILISCTGFRGRRQGSGALATAGHMGGAGGGETRGKTAAERQHDAPVHGKITVNKLKRKHPSALTAGSKVVFNQIS